MKQTKLGFAYFITEKRGRVLSLLYLWQIHKKHPPTIAYLALRLGLSRACVYEHLQRLLRDGFVEKVGCKYIVSAKGREYLA